MVYLGRSRTDKSAPSLFFLLYILRENAPVVSEKVGNDTHAHTHTPFMWIGCVMMLHNLSMAAVFPVERRWFSTRTMRDWSFGTLGFELTVHSFCCLGAWLRWTVFVFADRLAFVVFWERREGHEETDRRRSHFCGWRLAGGYVGAFEGGVI